MKTFFTFLFFSFITASVFANDVTVFFDNNKNYQVVIDGQAIAAGYGSSNSVYLPNLAIGRHTLQVYRLRGNNRRWNNNPVFATAFAVRPQYDVFISIDPYGRVAIDEKRERNRNDRYDRNERDDRYNRDDSYNRNPYDRYNNNYSNNYRRPITDNELALMMQYIKKQWLNDRLNTAKSAVSSNCLTTSQLRQVLELFSFDKDKLDLAKLGYRNIADPRNYYLLYDALSFRSSREELELFVKEYRY